MAENIDWQASRAEVLKRLHTKYDNLSGFLRNLPTIPYMEGAISPTEAIREVDHLSEEGKAIIKYILGK